MYTEKELARRLRARINWKELAGIKREVGLTLEAMKLPPEEIRELVFAAETEYVMRSTKYPPLEGSLLKKDVKAWCKERLSWPVFAREAHWIKCRRLYRDPDRCGGLIGLALESVKRVACLTMEPAFEAQDKDRMSFFLAELELLLYETYQQILALTGRRAPSPNVAICRNGTPCYFYGDEGVEALLKELDEQEKNEKTKGKSKRKSGATAKVSRRKVHARA